jgi:P27 family predicted phage terminase small subunit
MPAHRKSAEQKRLHGTDQRCRRRQPVAHIACARAPLAPRDMSEAARKVWRSLAPILVRLGRLGEADMPAFRLLAETIGVVAEAQETIKAKGLTVTGGGGTIKANPAVRMLETARVAALRMLCEFGLTPRSRLAAGLPLGPRAGAKPGRPAPGSLDEFLAEPEDGPAGKYFT